MIMYKMRHLFWALFIYIPFGSSLEVGVGTHMIYSKNTPHEMLKLISDYGFTSFRDGISWNATEKSSGVMGVTGLSQRLDDIYMGEKTPIVNNSMFILAYGNHNYTNNGRPQNREQVDAFVNYAKWIANRYKGRVKYYEIWNEWLINTGVDKKTSIPPDEVYLYLVQETYKVLKEADPNAIVVTGSIDPIYDDQVAWIKRLLKMGMGNYIDGISIHPYTYFETKRKDLIDPNSDMKVIDIFEDKINRFSGRKIPLYITEMGYPTTTSIPGGVTADIAAKYIYEYTLLASQRNYIKGIWWYELVDSGTNLKNKENNFGLFYSNLEPKESARVMKKLLPIIKNKVDALEMNESDISFTSGHTQYHWNEFKSK